MGDTEGPRNRKERRAAARDGKKKGDILTAADVPLAQPDRSGPKGKTLFEIADEKRAEMAKKHPELFKNHAQDDELAERAARDFSDDPLGAFGEAILYSTTLTMLHFTLDVLVYNQYRQEIVWKDIFMKSGKVLPVLLVVVWLLHTETAMKLKTPRQLIFLATAIAAGCNMIYSGNREGYYAVMKRAPPIGTIWVWAVLELQLPYAVGSVVVVLGYLWWNGFTAF
jgi:hypothetical protein